MADVLGTLPEIEITNQDRIDAEKHLSTYRLMAPRNFKFDLERIAYYEAVCRWAMATFVNSTGYAYLRLGVPEIYARSDAEIVALINHKVVINKRSAGARAVTRKYGQEAAEKIIEKHAGRKIKLQG